MYTELLNRNKPDQVSIVPEETIVQTIKSNLQLQQKCSDIRFYTKRFNQTNDIQVRDKKELLKAALPGFIPAGEFSYRRNSSILKYWGRIVLDIDNHKDPERLRARIKSDKEASVIMAFLSPSGTGLKVIHKLNFPNLDSPEEIIDFHRQAFQSLIPYYKKKYQVEEIDESGSDLARLCYFSHDDKMYYNPDAKDWAFQYRSISSTAEPILKSSIEGYYLRFQNDPERTNIRHTEEIIRWCKKENVSLLEHYNDWVRAIFALKNSISDDRLGLDLFLQLSAMSSKFDEQECIQKWQNTQPDGRTNKTTLGTLVYLAKSLGWKPSRNTSMGKGTLMNSHVVEMEESNLRLKYNELTHQIHYNESPDEEIWRLANDYIDGKIRLDILKLGMKRDDADSFIKYIPPRYNPVDDFLKSLPLWDGVDRLESLIATLELKPGIDKGMPTRLIKRWLLGVINGLHNRPTLDHDPSISPNENLLILIGPQGIGKTRWMRKLMPEGWHQLMAEKLSFNFDDKDDKLLACEKAIICMDEMAPVLNRKATNEQLKGFLSQKTFNVRVAYGRYNNEFYKIASFIGTSNENELITDPTGSRRFWPIDIVSADYNHTVEMDQLWAQSYHLWKSSERHWLSPEEQQELNNYNTEFTKVHPYEEYIARFVEHGNDPLTATQIGEYINERLNNNNAVNPRQLGVYLKKSGFTNETRWLNNRAQRVYDVTLLPESDMGEFRKLDAKNIAKLKRLKKKAFEQEDDRPNVELL